MKYVLCVFIGVLIAAAAIGAAYLYKAVDTSAVDNDLAQMITSADEEIARAEEHRKTTYERVEVIRYETSRKVFALDPDELVAHALTRAERFRRRLAASSDIARAAGVAVERAGILAE